MEKPKSREYYLISRFISISDYIDLKEAVFFDDLDRAEKILNKYGLKNIVKIGYWERCPINYVYVKTMDGGEYAVQPSI